jgi:CubicO group peptidase (beta-lactamase class C family)
MLKKYCLQLLIMSMALFNLTQVGAKETQMASAEFDQKITRLMAQHHVPALGVGVIKQGKLTYEKVFGELKKGSPAGLDTAFNVASLTKPVVTMLTMRLVNNGLWELDAPLNNYWVDPDVKHDKYVKQLTTRHILSHQTGFKNWRFLEPDEKLKFNFEPGTDFNYSGEGFEYLRNALERKFDRSLESLVEEYLFKPLKMNDSGLLWDESAYAHRFAQWHGADGVKIYPNHQSTEANAADDLITTVADYAKFAEYVLSGAGLSKQLYREMVTPQNAPSTKIKMGLGWELIPELDNKQYAILHTGADKGVKALVMLLPETKEGLIIMTNGDNGHQMYAELILSSLSLGKQIMATAN